MVAARPFPPQLKFFKMIKNFAIREMTMGDFEFADSLRAMAGWNQTLRDWRRFLELDSKGCFIAERNGELAGKMPAVPVGTATTIRYENKIAWIGMVLVHPEQRRHGIGRGLVLHCIEYLKECGVECIKLDATPLGKKLYDTLGFVDEWTMTRWRGVIIGGSGKNFDAVDLAEAAAWDERAFGANRAGFIGRLAGDCETVFLKGKGFAMRREGSRANHLGPVVASDSGAAIEMIEALLRPGEVIIDVPDYQEALADWARKRGLISERQLTRMRLGPAGPAVAPETLFAIAAPETG
jgi:ribosomal protein S18 acetylase RimI-like enzyme